MLDGNNSGWILNAMHSREGCYTYVKEILKGESFVELAEEEAEALDKAIYGKHMESTSKKKRRKNMLDIKFVRNNPTS